MSSIDYKKMSEGYAAALGTYQGNRTFGTSFADQYRNANRALGYLQDIKSSLDPDASSYYDLFKSGAKGVKGSAIAGSAIAGITAGTEIIGNALQAGQIADTTQQQNEIADLSRVGTYGYNNFDEIARDYAYTDFSGPDINYDDIRGMSTGEKIGNIGTSALSGAAAGMQIGGPWGAAIGGVIGAGASLWGVLSGDRKAKNEESFLNAQADMASSMANSNLSAAHERILKNNDRQGAVHAVANGGFIQRYTNSKLSKPHQREYKCGGRITRTKGEGGTIIRIRAK